ncbi:MAG: hypothetical protein HY689_00315 [Chloroflexi bacterium]|nr:hypothetical protein [Chloroflexota bacterium]
MTTGVPTKPNPIQDRVRGLSEEAIEIIQEIESLAPKTTGQTAENFLHAYWAQEQAIKGLRRAVNNTIRAWTRAYTARVTGGPVEDEEEDAGQPFLPGFDTEDEGEEEDGDTWPCRECGADTDNADGYCDDCYQARMRSAIVPAPTEA